MHDQRGARADPSGPVFVVGEALVDVAVGLDGVTRRMPGGSPMNVAFGTARLGVPTTLLTAFGDDEDGGLLADHLASAGVELAAGSVAEGASTSTALARLAADGSATYEFDLHWDIPSGARVPDGAIAMHTGSIAAAIEPGATHVLDLFERADAGVLRTFDPNVRPAITPDRDSTLERVERFARRAHILKLSTEDAAWLLPGASQDEVAEWGLALGARLVALTRGADGCVVTTSRHRVEHEGVRAEVVDTIGAGDAFMSALIAGAARWRLVEALISGDVSEEQTSALATLAQRAAVMTVARAGAQPPTWERVIRD